MKQRKNRIASQGLNGGWEWYWLQNRVQNSAASFASANDSGGCDYGYASFEAGVRPVAKIKNPISAPACQVRNDEDEQEG